MKASTLIILLTLNFVYAKTACMGGEGFAEIFNVEENFGADLSNNLVKPQLKYKGFLAPEPEDLRNYSANTISELLVDRIQEGCDKERGGKEKKSIEETSEVMMMVNDSLYDSIDKYGFKINM